MAELDNKSVLEKIVNVRKIIGIGIMFFGPKAQRWDRQGHSAPKERKKKEDRARKKASNKIS